jgi:hypothetical protein
MALGRQRNTRAARTGHIRSQHESSVWFPADRCMQGCSEVRQGLPRDCSSRTCREVCGQDGYPNACIPGSTQPCRPPSAQFCPRHIMVPLVSVFRDLEPATRVHSHRPGDLLCVTSCVGRQFGRPRACFLGFPRALEGFGPEPHPSAAVRRFWR